MSSYSKKLIFLIILILFSSCSIRNSSNENNKIEKKEFTKVVEKPFELEDFYIIYALEMENSYMYANARELYLKLFLNTNKYEYLLNFATISIQLQDYKAVENEVSKYLIPNIKEEEILTRLYSFSLLRLEKIDEAFKYAQIVASKYENSINLELLGTIYISKQDYEKAYKVFLKALKYGDSNSLIQTTSSLEFFYLNKKTQAINRLKDYLPKSEYAFDLSIQLLAFYENLLDEKNFKNLLKEMFIYYKNNDNALQVNKTLVIFFEKMNEYEIILFLEENKFEDDLLIELYRRTNQYEKGYLLLEKLYKESSNSNYLAQMAIFEFEMSSQNPNNSLLSIINKFEIALQNSTNPIYQNYLAYLLIDYDVDYERGLFFVKKALEQDPTNIAFLDTLAWGYYKIKNCKEAFKIMKQIVDEIGLSDEEIRLHWEKIKECK